MKKENIYDILNIKCIKINLFYGENEKKKKRKKENNNNTIKQNHNI